MEPFLNECPVFFFFFVICFGSHILCLSDDTDVFWSNDAGAVSVSH